LAAVGSFGAVYTRGAEVALRRKASHLVFKEQPVLLPNSWVGCQGKKRGDCQFHEAVAGRVS
jgi:hypothetical protein